MSVVIKAVEKRSPAARKGIKPLDVLVSINGNEIMDVLDYRFYQNEKVLELCIINSKGKQIIKKIKKAEEAELGLLFETYLMDEKHSCKNKCIFCFIDQLPKGLRDTLYFKDDDSRLSFLFGNYITLTNITEHEIERIIKMHISPINISVHTTNPELRVKMMTNKNAGQVLSVINRFNEAGIKMNCQLVLCPGINDGEELERSLNDLTSLSNVECIALVPVGITAFRENLPKLDAFDKKSAEGVLKICDDFAEKCVHQYGDRRVYCADEFYLLAKRQIPSAEFYGEFLQLENGVGLWSLLLSESEEAINDSEESLLEKRKISIATGEAAYPLICDIVDKAGKKWHNLECRVYAVKNNFFGGKIDVAGLVTATDIYEQLKDKDLGEELLIPSVMLRNEGDLFLDSISVDELSQKLNVKIIPVDNDGYCFIDRLIGR